MRRWEDELRRLVAERGDDLTASAVRASARTAATIAASSLVVSPAASEASPDPAPEPGAMLEDALVRVYSRRRASAREPDAAVGPGSVRLVTDDELDEPLAEVRRALASASGAVDLFDDDPLDAADTRAEDPPGVDVSAVVGPPAGIDLPAVVARVRTRRRRAVVGWSTGTGLAAALAVVLVVTGGGSDPSAATTHTATSVPITDACATLGAPGTHTANVSPGTDRTLNVHLSTQTDAVTATDPWVGAALDTTGTNPNHVDLGDVAPWPLLTRDGVVVGAATQPASAFADGPAAMDAPFEACSGPTLAAGQYLVVIDQPVRVGKDVYQLTSNAVPVTVLTDVPAGHQPPWLVGSPIACGMSFDELRERTQDVTPANLVPEGAYVDAHGLLYSFVNNAVETATYLGQRTASLLWVKDGVVRGVGRDASGSTGTVAVRGQTVLTLASGGWPTTDYCSPSPDGTYRHALPAGRYLVYGYARIGSPADPGDRSAWWVQRSGPAYVTVGADGTVTGW
jgi:hypothetical protein